jgi:hypothetical protein
VKNVLQKYDLETGRKEPQGAASDSETGQKKEGKRARRSKGST